MVTFSVYVSDAQERGYGEQKKYEVCGTPMWVYLDLACTQPSHFSEKKRSCSHQQKVDFSWEVDRNRWWALHKHLFAHHTSANMVDFETVEVGLFEFRLRRKLYIELDTIYESHKMDKELDQVYLIQCAFNTVTKTTLGDTFVRLLLSKETPPEQKKVMMDAYEEAKELIQNKINIAFGERVLVDSLDR